MRTKTILLVILSVASVLFVSLQVFFVCSCRGNLEILVCYESFSADLAAVAHLEIYIDGSKVIEDDQLESYYSTYSIRTTLGNHTAIVTIDGYASEEIKFNTILFTSVYIGYFIDKFRNEKSIYFSVQKHPIYFLS
jgi:hypothetical protein